MWSDWLVFCDYGFSVSALWCPLTTPTLLLRFLSPWSWGISSLLLQQSTAAAPYLGWGVSHQGHPSWHWTAATDRAEARQLPRTMQKCTSCHTLRRSTLAATHHTKAWPRGPTRHPRSGAVAKTSYPMSKELRLWGCRRATRSYSTFKTCGRTLERLRLAIKKSGFYSSK